jgi:hypothetical protein
MIKFFSSLEINGEVVYLGHAFQKETVQGGSISQQDLETDWQLRCYK